MKTHRGVTKRQVRTVALCLPVLAGGCQSVFDPAPYNPADDNTLFAPTKLPLSGPLLPFLDFKDAAGKMYVLGTGYRAEQKYLMRQRLALDVPAIGLGIATAANGVFNGAKDLTLALGIGSASLAGANAYLTPQTRVAAYATASTTLLCASSVAYRMGSASKDNATPAQDNRGALVTDIGTATDLIEGGKNATSAKDLMTARDNATKAMSDLDGAYLLLTNGYGRLQDFTMQVMNGAATQAANGAQNIVSVLATLKQPAGGAPSPAKTSPAPEPTTLGEVARFIKSPAVLPTDPASVIERLTQEAIDAENFSKLVNDDWSGFTKCVGS